MNGFQIFQPAWSFIDARLDGFLGDGLGAMQAQVATPLRAAIVLYVLLYGFAILRGAIAEPVMDFAIRSLKLAMVSLVATTPAYADWVTTPLFHLLPDALARALGGAETPDVGAAFDQFFARGAYLGEKLAAQASPVDFAPLLMSAAVFVIGALAAALGFGVATVAKVALALLLALGPAFVACALFAASRRFFFGWLAQAVNYIVLFALIVAIFQLILSLVAQQWSAIDGQDPMSAGLLFIALCLLAAIFFLQTPAIAAGVAGGASAGLADFAAAAATALRGTPRAVSAPPPPRSGGALRPARPN
jgi:type IV secretion system protein VirB6